MPKLTLSKSVLLTDLGMAVNRFRSFTPGIFVCFHVPVILAKEVCFIPGLVAQVNHGRLKQCEAEEQGFVGPPNFILDVFDATELPEYEARRSAFETAGVIEYVAIIAGAKSQCHWNRLSNQGFEMVMPDNGGIIKSKSLPGLWFNTNHQSGDEDWTIVDLNEYGITRLGHHELMESIWHKEGRSDWGDWLPFESG